MHKSLIALVFFVMSISAVRGQVDAALTKRLNIVMASTEKSDFSTILDYTYPKLFKLIPRDQMLEASKGALDNELFVVSVDSLSIVKIFPVFVVEEESFAKVKLAMRMKMKFKEAVDTSDADNINQRKQIATMMESQFGEGNVRYDRLSDALIIKQVANHVAIKIKEDHQWYFVNFDEDNPTILNYLFSKPVIEKLATYK